LPREGEAGTDAIANKKRKEDAGSRSCGIIVIDTEIRSYDLVLLSHNTTPVGTREFSG
jgi:hypothetical protein